MDCDTQLAIRANSWIFWGIFISKVCQTDLLFGVQSWLTSRSMHARLQIYVQQLQFVPLD